MAGRPHPCSIETVVVGCNCPGDVRGEGCAVDLEQLVVLYLIGPARLTELQVVREVVSVERVNALVEATPELLGRGQVDTSVGLAAEDGFLLVGAGDLEHIADVLD